MTVKLLYGHHLEFQSLKGCCIGSSESTLVKMPHCWKSHAMDHISSKYYDFSFNRYRKIIFARFSPHIQMHSKRNLFLGAQWLNGRVLASRPKGRGFEPHRRHCFVSLSLA